MANAPRNKRHKIEEVCLIKETAYSTNDSNEGNDLVKCGEIFIINKSSLVLICGYCNVSYQSIIEFGEHVQEKHINCDLERKLAPSKNWKIQDSKFPEAIGFTDTIVELSFHANNDLSQVSNSGSEYEGNGNMGIESIEESDQSDSESEREAKAKNGTSHPNNPQLFCEICDHQYLDKPSFQEHYSKKHSWRLSCRYCDKKCADKVELEDHNKTHDRERPYTCSHCQKSFTTKYYREQHIKVIHMGQKPHKCTECSSSFGTRGKLRVHMLTHSMPGLYSCEICGRQFIHQSRKDAHMRTHTGEKPFQCELCGQNFILQSRLTEHMKRHNNTKNHECELCNKKFYTNVMLKHHLVSHSTEKPFECPDCGRAFSRKKVLKMHRKIHSDVKQYSCDICGKEFSQFAGLYSHKKSHGKKISS